MGLKFKKSFLFAVENRSKRYDIIIMYQRIPWECFSAGRINGSYSFNF